MCANLWLLRFDAVWLTRVFFPFPIRINFESASMTLYCGDCFACVSDVRLRILTKALSLSMRAQYRHYCIGCEEGAPKKDKTCKIQRSCRSPPTKHKRPQSIATLPLERLLICVRLEGLEAFWEIWEIGPEFSFRVFDYNSYVKVVILGNLCGGALSGLPKACIQRNLVQSAQPI